MCEVLLNAQRISLATIGVCVFVRLLRWAHFLFDGEIMRKVDKLGRIVVPSELREKIRSDGGGRDRIYRRWRWDHRESRRAAVQDMSRSAFHGSNAPSL